MKRLLLLLPLTFFLFICSGLKADGQIADEHQDTVCRLIIMDGYINDTDYTKTYFENNSYHVFFNDGNGQLNMSCIWEKSQSYGPVKILAYSHTPKTDTEYERDKLNFRWYYHNTYDSEEGICYCELDRINRIDYVFYELRIVTDKWDIMVYRGVAVAKEEHTLESNLTPFYQ